MHRVCSGTYTGSLHLMEGEDCQDSSYTIVRDNIAVIVVCDGAGSRQHSGVGAKACAKIVGEYVLRVFWGLYEGFKFECEHTKEIFVRNVQNEMMGAVDYDMSEVLCTLCFFAGDNEGRWICGHIGDGIAFMSLDGLRVVSEPENGYYKNETFFINQQFDIALQHFRISLGKESHSYYVLLSTDGCQDLFWKKITGEISETVKDICKWLDHGNNYAYSNLLFNFENVLSSMTDDDMGIAFGKFYIDNGLEADYDKL